MLDIYKEICMTVIQRGDNMLDKTISVRIDEQLHSRLMEVANKKGAINNDNYNMTDIVREFIIDGLNQNNKKILIGNMYNPIGREILMVDRMIGERSKVAKYERDIASKSYIMPASGKVPKMVIEAEEIDVPFFRIAANPMWDIDDDHLSESIVKQSKNTIQMNEDVEIIKLLELSISANEYVKEIPINENNRTKNNSLPIKTKHIFEGECMDTFNQAYNSISEHQLDVKNIIFNPVKKDKVIEFNNYLKTQNKEELNMLKSLICPKDIVFMTAAPEYVGVIAIKQDITSVDHSEPQSFKKGKVIWETIGISVMNNYSVAGVKDKNKSITEGVLIQNKE